jgi:hypothetical protein
MKVTKPSPELKKLGYFVGTWITQGTITRGPWGAGGEFSWTERTKWMVGRFFLVGRWNFKMPADMGGDGEELFVIGFDPSPSVYTFDAFSSQGLHQISRGTCIGDTWTWTSEGFQDGRPVQQKMTMRVLSRTSYLVKFEISSDGAAWMTFMEGKARKQKAHIRRRSAK